MRQAAGDLLDGTCNPDGSWSADTLAGRPPRGYPIPRGPRGYRTKAQEKQLRRERADHAIAKLKAIGIDPERSRSGGSIRFEHKGSTVEFQPYTREAKGDSIEPVRGLQQLLKQLKS